MSTTSPFHSSTASTSTSSITDTTSSMPGGAPDTTGPLRRVLRLDAAVVAVSGLALVIAAGPLARAADIAAPGVVRLIGLGLVVLAVDLVLLARSRRSTLVGLTPFSAAADVGWMVASFVVAIGVAMNPAARAVIAVQGALVGGVALAKFVTRRRLVASLR